MSARKRPYFVGIVVMRHTPQTSLLLLQLSTAVRGLAPHAYLYSSFAYLWCSFITKWLICVTIGLFRQQYGKDFCGKVRLLAMHLFPLCLG